MVSELGADGVPTIADVGITYPLVDTYLTHKSTEERGFAPNKYGDKKNKDYSQPDEHDRRRRHDDAARGQTNRLLQARHATEKRNLIVRNNLP